MTKPIKPEEVQKIVPDEVIDAFNELIQENWNGREATFKQKDIMLRIRKKLNLKINESIDLRWLDVEPIYAKEGWKVTYDSPAYNESYASTFRFRPKE